MLLPILALQITKHISYKMKKKNQAVFLVWSSQEKHQYVFFKLMN